MPERETVTSALAGPLVNALATSAGVAPCAPIPGSSRMDCGSSFRGSLTARAGAARAPRRPRVPGEQRGGRRHPLAALAPAPRVRGADDGPDAREATLS